ncbi:hypothetical protein C8N46_103464 [Kordia periserrulae]|uniref:Uncharacterized protein n=2 Tax=Kordia periserrulae TaxID=701523 RepID=A0A2T6C212_9FLAO|nr:hypothetical protein C8N46_103464 [Kordia periserrulae]
MKKQQFNMLNHRAALQILGGITDPNNDPDEDHAGEPAPAGGDTSSDDKTNATTRPSRN